MARTAAPTPTTAFRPLGAPVVRRPTPGGGRRKAWIAGLAAAATAVIVLLVANLGGSSRPPAAATSAAEPASTDARLEKFATDYVTTASNDPDAGFAMLTPRYQKSSGGPDGYRGFWSNVSNVEVGTVSGDAATSSVVYTYSYDFKGERRTEDVALQLEKKGDTFLIDGAS